MQGRVVKQARIAKFRANVSEVDAADVKRSLAGRGFRSLKRVGELLDVWMLDRVDPPEQEVVKRPDQDGHDGVVASVSQHVLQENDLKLDRVFETVDNLVVEQVVADPTGQSSTNIRSVFTVPSGVSKSL